MHECSQKWTKVKVIRLESEDFLKKRHVIVKAAVEDASQEVAFGMHIYFAKGRKERDAIK